MIRALRVWPFLAAFAFATLALVAVVLAFGSSQAITRNDLETEVNTNHNFTWSGADPGDTTLRAVSRAYFIANVQNNGSCASGSNATYYVMTYSDMQACAVNTSVHTPILANNTFSGGSFASWSDTTTVYSGCASGASVFAGVNAADQDSDSGFARGGSGIVCINGPTATVGYTQTFTISGTPTSQSYSVYYNGTQVTAGDQVNCSQGTGTVANLIVKINGVTETTVASPTLDGAWHQVSGSTSDLANGSNTFEIDITLSGALGSHQNPTLCNGVDKASQTLSLDTNVLTATY